MYDKLRVILVSTSLQIIFMIDIVQDIPISTKVKQCRDPTFFHQIIGTAYFESIVFLVVSPMHIPHDIINVIR